MTKMFTRCFIATIMVTFVFAVARLTVYAREVEIPVDTNLIGNGAYALIYYEVTIAVNEDNTFDITEEIVVNFNEARHGIVRRIPLRNEVVRLDGTTATNRAQISNIQIFGGNGVGSVEGNYRVIRIGDENQTITGFKDYRIKYTYDIGRDTGKNYDEFYFNIVGSEWDTTISNIHFTITMPKEFEAGKVGFSHGRKGATDSDKVTFSVAGNTISGTYDDILLPGEALTVRLELPEGYFVRGRGSATVDWLTLLSFGLPLACVLAVFLMWYLIGRDERVFEVVEFYPPEGMNSADAGFALRGASHYGDVISLLVYLANKGYLRIEEYEEKVMFAAQKSFKFIKLKDYQGFDQREDDFLKGLFAEKDEVVATDLQFKFHKTMDKILESYNTKSNREKLFYSNSLNKNLPLVLMMLAILAVNLIKPVMISGSFLAAFAGVLFPFVGLTAFINMALPGGNAVEIVDGRPKKMTAASGVFFGLLFGVVFIGVGLFTLLYLWGHGDFLIALDDPDAQLYLVSLALGALSFNAITFFMTHMPKRTPYGTEILGRLKGFKHFLNTVEKPRLEALVAEDPEYFYHILPYAYVLNVYDRWMEKFESIAIRPPDWYGGAAFTTKSFGSFMDSTFTTVGAMSLPPLQSSGSSGRGFSGGGRSGGGSGGGGGSSW